MAAQLEVAGVAVGAEVQRRLAHLAPDAHRVRGEDHLRRTHRNREWLEGDMLGSNPVFCELSWLVLAADQPFRLHIPQKLYCFYYIYVCTSPICSVSLLGYTYQY